MNSSSVKRMGTGDMTDDDLLNLMGDAAIISRINFPLRTPSAENTAFVAGFKKFTGTRPNFVSVAVYDGMRVIYEALKKTAGDTDGDKLITAMRGLSSARSHHDRSENARYHSKHLHSSGRTQGTSYRNLCQARSAVGAFIETVYNRQRLHSALACRSPDEYEATLGDLQG
jgi:hypothetical protein